MIEPSTDGAGQDWRRLDAALHGFFRARVADAEQRADLVQEVLLRMHERRDQLREQDRIDAWAFRIARNALIDHYRRRAGDAPLPAELASELATELGEAAPEHPADAPRLLGTWLRGQIESLPPRYREALELTELRGLSQREAARLLGVPDSTLKSRVQRGRDQLHAALLRCCDVELDARGRVMDFAPRDRSNACGCSSGCAPPEQNGEQG